jgi:hypothetical protein
MPITSHRPTVTLAAPAEAVSGRQRVHVKPVIGREHRGRWSPGRIPERARVLPMYEAILQPAYEPPKGEVKENPPNQIDAWYRTTNVKNTPPPHMVNNEQKPSGFDRLPAFWAASGARRYLGLAFSTSNQGHGAVAPFNRAKR